MEETVIEMKDFGISIAASVDIEAIKSIADLHRRELGFVLRPALVDAIERKAILVARIQNSGELAGFVHFRHRRDLRTKIYQICVAPAHRNQGVAAELLVALKHSALKAGQVMLTLQCPEGLPANSFYARLGFRDEATIEGRKRRLIIWSLPLHNV